ncbi:MAG: ParB/RepB/Spo0J family partition protein [Myxococcales bacterium]|nr:MAG: ParB/RepB/Spo0J family partition protein [Myxococcales bacterium]
MSNPKPSARPSALGKGLAALIPQTAGGGPADPGGDAVRRIPIERIRPMPGQPRTTVNKRELEELAASIREQGVLQPILVRAAGPDYQLIAGERRWRAAQLAGLATVPVIVKNVDETTAFELALIENLQREDLNPADVARAFKRLVEDFRLTQEEVSTRVGKDRATVANYLRLLKLPPLILARVEDGVLSFGHARALAALTPSELAGLDLHPLIAGRVSVRELERLVARMRERAAQAGQGAKPSRPESPQVRYVQRRLEQKLGVRVVLQDKNGKGRLILEYKSLAELDGVLALLGINDEE